LRGDESLLKRVVMNLVDNAIKYTPAGGQVKVSTKREGEMALVEVADSGPGVAPDDRQRIFERFYRAAWNGDGGGASKPAGAGLGLAIARWVARAHGGDVVLARSDAHGSTFRVAIPCPSRPA
ncbi:MAG: ATP-binding protein, partial [Gemmatimonadaceae bacterium]